ncbi:hypothetical protein [Planctomycetes bacterium CA13]|uniref:hypothetical protein n=1 Tax=Novipirellula herctigrandis TaxID=2527986 RepID=UPI0011B645C5
MTQSNRYWRLSEDPFSNRTATWFFAGTPQKTALAELSAVLPTQPQGVAITAARYGGMTTLLRHLSTYHGIGDMATQFLFTKSRGRIDPQPIQNQLANGLQLPCSNHATFEQIESAMNQIHEAGIHPVWLSDGYSAGVTRLLKRLRRNCKFTAVISTIDQYAERSCELLGQATSLLTLQRFALEDTRQFIQQSMMRAGAKGESFDESAYVAIHDASSGRIGTIAELAMNALVVGYKQKLRRVTGATIERMCRNESSEKKPAEFYDRSA